MRANYEYRTQVEGLKRLLTERDHPKHDDRQEFADEDTRRVSLEESVREEGARDIAMLESHLKNETT